MAALAMGPPRPAAGMARTPKSKLRPYGSMNRCQGNDRNVDHPRSFMASSKASWTLRLATWARTTSTSTVAEATIL